MEYKKVPPEGNATLMKHGLMTSVLLTTSSTFQTIKDDQGRLVSSGLYLYQLTAGDNQMTKRLILAK